MAPVYTGVYCSSDDLLIGDITVNNASAEYKKFIDQASDEVDSRLGFMLETPISSSSVSRPGYLLVKRIAIFIASGRMIMAFDQSGEDSRPHQYAKYLLDQAEMAIEQITSGVVNINLPVTDTSETDASHNKVQVANLDAFSSVEAFYGFTAQPPAFGYGYYRGR